MDNLNAIGMPKSSQIYNGIKPNNIKKTNTNKSSISPLQDGYSKSINSNFSDLSLKNVKNTLNNPPNISEISPQPAKTGLTTPKGPTLETFEKTGEKEKMPTFEGFYLAGDMGEDQSSFGDFNLNGPSSLSSGIVTVGGMNINNPTFLIQE